MRWIVLSQSNPDQLLAALQSGAEFLPSADVFILFSWHGEHERLAYQAVREATRNGHWWFFSNLSNHFRDTMFLAIESARHDGKQEQLTLLTTDALIFTAKFSIATAYNILQKHPAVLGVNLFESRQIDDSQNSEHRERGQVVATIHVRESQSAWGIIYRTSCLISALYGREWDGIETLEAVLTAPDCLPRRTKIATLTTPTMETQPCPTSTSASSAAT